MTEEEIILQGKSTMWIEAFKEAKKTTGLSASAAKDMSTTEIMAYTGEHKIFNEPVKQIPLIDPKIEYEAAIKEVDEAESVSDLKAIWERNKKHHNNPEFSKYVTLAKSQLEKKEREPELGF